MDISDIRTKLSTSKFSVPDQSFDIECASLRPYTRYYVIFDNLNYSQFCSPNGKDIGAPLISDAYGKLKFTFFWTRENQSYIIDNHLFSGIFDNTSGNKILTVTDKNGSSFARKTIYFTNNSPDIMFSKYVDASNIVKN